MEYVLISLLAGILTVLAPCVFTLLPVILGGSLSGTTWKKPAIIIGSLSASIFIFTLLLKASTLLIDIHPSTWSYISGGIIFTFGLLTLFPNLWEQISLKLGIGSRSDKLLDHGARKDSVIGDIMIGIALGPVFSSCSPTYTLIIATTIPQDTLTGLINLTAYIFGLGLVLSIIAVSGQKITTRFKWAVNPDGIFKKSLGVLFLVIGFAIFTGLDKDFETFLLDQGLFSPSEIELNLLDSKEE